MHGQVPIVRRRSGADAGAAASANTLLDEERRFPHIVLHALACLGGHGLRKGSVVVGGGRCQRTRPWCAGSSSSTRRGTRCTWSACRDRRRVAPAMKREKERVTRRYIRVRFSLPHRAFLKRLLSAVFRSFARERARAGEGVHRAAPWCGSLGGRGGADAHDGRDDRRGATPALERARAPFDRSLAPVSRERVSLSLNCFF